MLVCLWTLKAGTGCSVTAAMLALERGPVGVDGATLVGLDDDLAAVLGVLPASGEVGLAEWLAAGDEAPGDALRFAARPVVEGVGLVGPGAVPIPDVDPTDRQLDALDNGPLVVVDAGCITRPGPEGRLARCFAAHATRSILVTRACYLALRRAPSSPVTPSEVLLLDEPGRSLRVRDIESVTGAPVVASIAIDPAVARAVDAGLRVGRVPRGVGRALQAVA